MSVFETTDNLQGIFKSPQTLATRTRAAAYLRRTYQLFTRFSPEEIKQNFLTSLFVFDLPNETAYVTEQNLVTAIGEHSIGVINDPQIKKCLKDFVDAHTVLLFEDGQKTKRGKPEIMQQSNLVYLRFGDCGRMAFVCNPLQKLIIEMTFGEIFTICPIR